MAPKANKTTGLRGLAYQESFFGNRNDMLQTALDSVLVTYQDEMEKYEASVELYKDAQALIAKERARIQGIIDGLLKEQIKGTQAAQQFNAGQLNSSSRTQAGIDASNARFNARQAALAEYYGTKRGAAGTKGVDDVTISEAKQAYAGNIDDAQAGVDAYKLQTQQTTEVPKTATERDIGTVYTVDQYVSKELEKDVYQKLPPELQKATATDAVLKGLKEEDANAYRRGILALQARATGKGGAPAEEVQIGDFKTQLVRAPDYSDLIMFNQERLKMIEDMERPEAPEAPDLIKLQRDEYFKSFYPGYLPAYQVNEAARALSNLSNEEAQALLALYRSRAPQPIDRPIDSPEVSRFTPPRMLGDVIYGDESPFVPPPSRTTPEQARRIKEYEETGVAELTPYFRGIPTLVPPKPRPAIPSQIDRALANVDALTQALKSAEDAGDTAIADKIRALLDQANIDLDIALFESGTETGYITPTEAKALDAIERSKLIKEKAKDQKDPKVKDLLIKKAKELEARSLKVSEAERLKRTDVVEAEKVEAAKFEYPIERRGGELVTPLRKPLGIIDRKELKEKTTDEKDINFKIKTAERAKALDEDEYNRLLETPVGREVKELYDVAKAKGTDETGKEFLSYIAQMYPKRKDQEDAATLYYNLAYTDEVAGKLGLEDKKGGRK